MAAVFVFGSNLAGIHGAGAAVAAFENWGAEWWCGEGRKGDTYAIPTKDKSIVSLSLAEITVNVNRFLHYARIHLDDQFLVTKVGCGLAGFSEDDIKPMFKDAPPNCTLPKGWR